MGMWLPRFQRVLGLERAAESSLPQGRWDEHVGTWSERGTTQRDGALTFSTAVQQR